MSGEQHRKHRTRKSADCVREYFVREYRGYSNATAAACNATKYHGDRISPDKRKDTSLAEGTCIES
jgi:hypothetical protein